VWTNQFVEIRSTVAADVLKRRGKPTHADFDLSYLIKSTRQPKMDAVTATRVAVLDGSSNHVTVQSFGEHNSSV
jgi:hypothetical protein